MAAGDPNAARDQRGPGYLIKAPTNLSSPGTNYGGTLLGLSRDHGIQLIDEMFVVPGEEYGGLATEGIEGGKGCIFGALFRGWDADVLAAIYANTASSTGSRIIRVGTSQTVKAGHRVSDRAIKLLFVPLDVTNHRAVLIPRALPMISEDSRTALSIFREPTHAVSFVGMPDATGRVAEVDILSNLTL